MSVWKIMAKVLVKMFVKTEKEASPADVPDLGMNLMIMGKHVSVSNLLMCN